MTKPERSSATQVHERAVIWIDHLAAKIFAMGLTGVTPSIVRAKLESTHLHHKANTIGSGRVKEDPAFLAKVAEAVAPCYEILVLGPGIEKTALVDYLASKRPDLTIRSESCDHPTDDEIIGLGRKHFHLG
jgi:stalled ribosome rescue protein Dom34